MIKYLFILLIVILSPLLTGCTEANLTHSVALVPRPAQLVSGSGNYLFSKKTVFTVENKESAAGSELYKEPIVVKGAEVIQCAMFSKG